MERRKPYHLSLSQDQLFKINYDRHGVATSFVAPNGDKYDLKPGERLVQEYKGGTTDKVTFVQSVDGEKILFDEWKEDKFPN